MKQTQRMTAVFHQFLDLIGEFISISGRKFWVALFLLLLSSFTEGISIFLLLPLLHIMNNDQGNFIFNISELGSFSSILPNLQISLPWVLALFVLLIALQVTFTRIKSIYLVVLLNEFVCKIRIDLFDAIVRASWEKVSKSRVSKLEHALTSEIDKINATGFFTLNFCQNLVMLSIYLVVSFMISPPLTLAVIVIGILLLAMMHPFRVRSTNFGVSSTTNREQQFAIISDFLTGMKVAKLLSRENFYFQQLDKNLSHISNEGRNYVGFNAIGTAIMQICGAVCVAVFTYLALIILEISFVEFLVLLVILLRAFPKITAVQIELQQFLVGFPAYLSVRNLTSEFQASKEDLGDNWYQDVPQLSSQLVLKNISYEHNSNGRRFSLENVSLKINKGQIVAFVGLSGSGKTTLVDLVSGLLEKSSGQILIDGTSLDNTLMKGWRSNIAIVTQDVFLLNDTIRMNMEFFNKNATQEEMFDALDAAQALAFVNNLPHGLDTVVGERGSLLSGGERQRIAIACAVLRKPKLLILDEATSAIDLHNQSMIINSLKRLRSETTIILIDHRPSMISIADKVFVLEQGKIVERGKFSKLVNKSGGKLARIILET